MLSTKPVFIFLFTFISFVATAFASDNVKLYTLDCGTYEVSDISVLSDTGEYEGQSLIMANPCFLIRHPKGDLLWDTGHNDNLAEKKEGEISGVWHAKLTTKLQQQLSRLELKIEDIEYLSLSHVHPDHAGNANKFVGSTFVVNTLERQYMFSEPAQSYFGQFYSALQKARTISFTHHHDVFNDNSVVIHSMPGHTPGSSALLVKLAKAGNILLSGDLYLHAQGRKLNTVHKFNDKKQTLNSRKKFEALAKKQNARVIIQHDMQNFNSLPRFPAFLD